MRPVISAALIGLVFGAGIAVSGMINPEKVLNFFDFAGSWDPSLALVMASALAVTAVGYRIVLRRAAPLCAPSFQVPTHRKLDRPLILGSMLFGAGWGITGFCPGGAVPALGLLEPAAWTFVASMAAGITASRFVRQALHARRVGMA